MGLAVQHLLGQVVQDVAVAAGEGGHEPGRVGLAPQRQAVEADGQVIGLIQYWEEQDPDYRHAAIDIFLHPDWHGRGLGADAIRTLARYLFERRGHHRITIDPAAHNAAAIRCYEKAGFKPVGVLRLAERDADGRGWHDSLLMELVVEPKETAAG